MSSVVVGWTGRCQDQARCKRLASHLRRLAETSDSFLRTHRPPGNASPTRRLGQRQRRANIEQMRSAAQGTVLVASDIALDEAAVIEAARAAKLDIVANTAGHRRPLIVVPDARFSGIDFRLFDPRDLHPGADRLSFVFLETKAAPFLDGRLVQVDLRAAGKQHVPRDPAEVYLRAPEIELDGYLEDWSDLLLSWVKYFFIEDLRWRRREEMQGYDDYRDVFLDVDTTLGKERAERSTFDAVLATFAQHAEHWREEVAAGALA